MLYRVVLCIAARFVVFEFLQKAAQLFDVGIVKFNKFSGKRRVFFTIKMRSFNDVVNAHIVAFDKHFGNVRRGLVKPRFHLYGGLHHCPFHFVVIRTVFCGRLVPEFFGRPVGQIHYLDFLFPDGFAQFRVLDVFPDVVDCVNADVAVFYYFFQKIHICLLIGVCAKPENLCEKMPPHYTVADFGCFDCYASMSEMNFCSVSCALPRYRYTPLSRVYKGLSTPA